MEANDEPAAAGNEGSLREWF